MSGLRMGRDGNMSNQDEGWLMGRILDEANGNREGHFRYRQKPGIRESPRNLQLAFRLVLLFKSAVDADTLWSLSSAAAPENKSITVQALSMTIKVQKAFRLREAHSLPLCSWAGNGTLENLLPRGFLGFNNRCIGSKS